MAGDHAEPQGITEANASSSPIESSEESLKPAISADDPMDEAKTGNFWRILSYGTSLDWLLMGIASLCSVGAGVALPLMNIIFGKLVGDFTAFFIPGTGVTREQFLTAVNKNALYIVYLFIAKFVLAYISIFSFRITGIRISAALRLAYLRALFAQPISVFDKLPPGKATSMITSSANTIQIGISEKLSILLQSLALVIGAYVIAFRYSWALTLVSSSVILFIMLVYGFTVPLHLKALRLVEKANESASAVAGESFSSIRTIVACGAEERTGLRYAEWMKQARIRGLKMSGLTGVQLAPAFFAIYCNFALTFWFGVRLFNGHHIAGVSTVVTVFFSVIIVVTAIGGIATPVTDISKSASASTGFFLTIDKPTRQTTGLKEPEASAHEDIIFDDVTFAYPSRPDVKVLENFSARFPAGQLTAIVGPSGSGKSTIVALLERWYQIDDESAGDAKSKPAEIEKQSIVVDGKYDSVVPTVNLGSITTCNHQLQTLDLKWWRSQIGLVQQEPFTFNASIYKNVAYGLVGSKWEHCDDKEKLELVKEACKEAYADEFINRLPLGYETMVGENGIKLSGGQRQRLAIARSIIKRPPILILDEATSAIDVRGEAIVQKALDRVSRKRTTISIAHRLSTVKRADNIIVLKNGAIAEQGTHQSLLANEAGVYHSLVHAQHLEMKETSSEDSLEDDALVLEQTISGKDSKSKVFVMSDTVSRREEEVKVYKPRSLLRTVGFFLYEQRIHWKLYGLGLAAAIGCGAAFAVQSYIFAQLIAVFQLTGPELTDRGNFWSLMFFIEAICVGIFYFVLGWTASSISIYVSTTYRQQYFESILGKPIAFYDVEENSAGSLTSRLSTDPTQLQELLGANMAFPLIAVFNVLGCIAISFAFGWKLTLVTVFSALPVIVSAGFMRVRFEIQFEKLNAAVFAESSQFASEAIGAFRTVTSLTLEDTITDRYTVLLRDHVRKAFLKARLATLIFAASDSLQLLCMALCFWYGGRLLSTREYNIVQFFVIFDAIVQGGQAAGQWSSFAPNIAQATAAANRILSLRSKSNSSTLGALTVPDDDAGGVKIHLKNVHFKYPGRDVPVFNGLNLTIEKGQFAALVGPSGCGKTSVISLLERFYNPQSGSITYNGTDISTIDTKAYRKRLSLVSQEPTLYQGSIRENLLLGVDADSVTDAQVHQACADAEIHGFIVSLPEGYSTPVGLKGVSLSGGQKQRISIARALLRKPSLLLLDEATSSLDSASEKLVQASFERAAKGRTMIVVAHRLATVQNADVIFVFGEGGSVVEVGDHGALVRKRGVYWGMCQSQALDR